MLYSEKMQWPSVPVVGGHELLRGVKISASSTVSQIKQIVSLVAGDCEHYMPLPFLYNQD